MMIRIILYSFKNTEIIIGGEKDIFNKRIRSAKKDYYLLPNTREFNWDRILPILNPTPPQKNTETILLIPSLFENALHKFFDNNEELTQKISWKPYNTNLLSDMEEQELKGFILKFVQNDEYKEEISSMAFSELFPEIAEIHESASILKKELASKDEWESVGKTTENGTFSDNELGTQDNSNTTNNKIFLVGFVGIVGILVIISTVFFENFMDSNNNHELSSSKEEYGELLITGFPGSEIEINGKKQENQTTPSKELIPAGKDIQIKLTFPDGEIEKCAKVDIFPNQLKPLGENHFKDCN